MATWITHLRIGEKLLFKGLSKDEFIVGNIGPDSGVPNEDCSKFNPSTKITHWRDDENKIDSKGFYDKYLKSNTREDNKQYSFYLGYYVHLLTDSLWSEFHNEIKHKKGYEEKLKNDPKFIWTIKLDWYGLDFLYLEKNSDNIFSKCFCKVENIEDYLEYFPTGAFNTSIETIKGYYLGENKETKENFMYLKEAEMDEFVDFASKRIEEILLEKDLIVLK